MSRFKIVNETDISVKDNYLDLREYMKIRPVVKIYDNIFTKKIVKSESGNHLFEIYDQIYIEKKSIRTLLNEINDKLDILLNIKHT